MKLCLLCILSLIACSASAQQKSGFTYSGIPTTTQPAVDTIKAEKNNHYTLKVYDVTGTAVLTKQLTDIQNGLSSCELKKGSYTYVVYDKNNKTVKKGGFSVDF